MIFEHHSDGLIVSVLQEFQTNGFGSRQKALAQIDLSQVIKLVYSFASRNQLKHLLNYCMDQL
jgi:hypothetical protein